MEKTNGVSRNPRYTHARIPRACRRPSCAKINIEGRGEKNTERRRYRFDRIFQHFAAKILRNDGEEKDAMRKRQRRRRRKREKERARSMPEKHVIYGTIHSRKSFIFVNRRRARFHVTAENLDSRKLIANTFDARGHDVFPYRCIEILSP